jgi:ATP-dependent metalloprotease
VIAATNTPESLDPALVRPGRFDKHVTVPNPDVLGRREILAVHTKNIPLDDDVDLSIIARGTPGFSGADLANLTNSAAIKAAVDKCNTVAMTHLEFAKDKILMGSERRSAVISDKTRKLTAYHEGGHALMCLHAEGAYPVYKATIVPRGQALGMVSQLPDIDMTSLSRQQMTARLLVCMGGRAAEELIYGAEQVVSRSSYPRCRYRRTNTSLTSFLSCLFSSVDFWSRERPRSGNAACGSNGYTIRDVAATRPCHLRAQLRVAGNSSSY